MGTNREYILRLIHLVKQVDVRALQELVSLQKRYNFKHDKELYRELIDMHREAIPKLEETLRLFKDSRQKLLEVIFESACEASKKEPLTDPYDDEREEHEREQEKSFRSNNEECS
jgi:hypothetical protein